MSVCVLNVEFQTGDVRPRAGSEMEMPPEGEGEKLLQLV